MKANVLSSLKTKYSNLGLSEKTLDGYAEKLAENIKEESEIENVVSGAEWMLKLAQAETDKVRGEKSQLQKQLDELKGKELVKEPAKESTEKPEWAIALEEQNKTLVETIQKLQNGEASKSRQAILKEAIKGTSEGFGKITKGSFEYLKNSSDEDFSNWLEGVKTEAKENIKIQSAYNPRGGVKIENKLSDDEANNIVENIIG